jgi:hypothetical protein
MVALRRIGRDLKASGKQPPEASSALGSLTAEPHSLPHRLTIAASPPDLFKAFRFPFPTPNRLAEGYLLEPIAHDRTSVEVPVVGVSIGNLARATASRRRFSGLKSRLAVIP